MSAPTYCPQCKTPDLCLIACPNNERLEQMKYFVHDRGDHAEPVEQAPTDLPVDDDEELEVVFEDAEEDAPGT